MNLLVLAGACLALAVAVSPAASGLLAVVGAVAVWRRGYLVPYTPRFAPRLVEALPWDPLPASAGHQPASRAAPADASGGGRSKSTGRGDGDRDGDETAERTPATLADATTADAEAVLSDLIEAGVVDATGDDVRPTDAFERRWWAAIRTLRELSPADLAAATLDEAPAASTAAATTERGQTYVVLSDGSGEPAGEVWLRRPVAVAETAAARALAETTDLDPGRRAVGAHGLAVFLDTCPVCESALVERKAGGCCGPPRTDAEGHPLQALVCTACRAQFAAFE